MRRTKAKPRLHFLSLAISAIALAVVGLFLFGTWLEIPNDAGEIVHFSGYDIATLNLQVTENFPAGAMFILPIVAGAILFQHYRRVATPERPSRRGTNAAMLALGILVVGLWVRTYILNMTTALNQNDPFVLDGTQSPYTNGEVIREFFTVQIWLCLGLSVVLLIFPFFDKRPVATSFYLNPARQENFKPGKAK